MTKILRLIDTILADCDLPCRELPAADLAIDLLRLIQSEDFPDDHLRAVASDLQAILVFPGGRTHRSMLKVTLTAARKDIE